MTALSTARTADTLLDDEPPSREELLALVDAMQRDWRHLNEVLNKTAQVFTWCSEWESRLAIYNQGFEVLKLEGRSEYASFGASVDPYLLADAVIERLRARRYDDD